MDGKGNREVRMDDKSDGGKGRRGREKMINGMDSKIDENRETLNI